jgi:1-acyl-sn-glycerol-3-phosphate acyltransferase
MSPTSTSGASAPSPSLGLKIKAYLLWNFMYWLSTVSALLVLIGPILSPQTVGLYLVLPYLTFSLFKRDELKFGSPWPYFSQKFVAFDYLRQYLNFEVAPLPEKLKRAEQAQNAQFIFAVFPHGTSSDFRILMDGILHTVLPSVADKVRVLSASVLFRIPLAREIALWTRCVDARRTVAEGLLDNQYSILVLPGGMDEQLLTQYQKETIYLRKRKGFIKLSLRKGVPVVPVYVFGSSDQFVTSNICFGVRHWIMKNLKICIPLARGLAGSACPLPVKTTIVMGEPMHFSPKIPGQPTQAEIDSGHADFTKAVIALFDEHKSRLGYGERSLNIL